MREEYFIDKVDIEWCFRARASKYQLFGTGRAHMYQRLGDGGIKVWFFGWRDVSSYSPLRVYLSGTKLCCDVSPWLCRLEMEAEKRVVYAWYCLLSRRFWKKPG